VTTAVHGWAPTSWTTSTGGWPRPTPAPWARPRPWPTCSTPLAGLVLGPERLARHVLVDGHHVVRDGRLLGADMDMLRRDLVRRARRLWPEDAR
jgi:hypothetical protein